MKSNALRFAHVNAQSLKAHFSEFSDTFSDVRNHVVAVSETWLQEDTLDAAVALPGYNLVRRDRCGKRGGGVAIYVREELTVRVLSSSSDTFISRPEYIFAEISCALVKPTCWLQLCIGLPR